MNKLLNYIVNGLVLLPTVLGTVLSFCVMLVLAVYINSKYYECPDKVHKVRKIIKQSVNSYL